MQVEQIQILNLVESYCKNLDVRWNKYKGDVVCRIVQRFIGNHLSVVVGPNAYIDGFPYEFDLLVVDNDSPRDLTLSYQPQNVRDAIEVKKGGIYSQSQLAKTKKMFDDVVSKCPHIKCAYFAVEEVQTVVKKNSINFYVLSKTTLGSHGFFALRDLRRKGLIVGDWAKFIAYL